MSYENYLFLWISRAWVQVFQVDFRLTILFTLLLSSVYIKSSIKRTICHFHKISSISMRNSLHSAYNTSYKTTTLRTIWIPDRYSDFWHRDLTCFLRMLSHANYIKGKSKLHAATFIIRFPVSALQVEVKISVGVCAHAGKGWIYLQSLCCFLSWIQLQHLHRKDMWGLTKNDEKMCQKNLIPNHGRQATAISKPLCWRIFFELSLYFT